MPTPKHYGRRQDAKGVPLWWPGTAEGFPFRGAHPGPITDEEYDATQLAADVGSAVLRIPEQMDKYLEIMDMIANGDWVLRFEKSIERPDQESWIVWLVWLEPYGVKAAPHHRNTHAPVSIQRPI